MPEILQERALPYAFALGLARGLQSCSILWACKKFCKDFLKEKPMKYLSKICGVAALSLSFTLSTYAGHIPCPGITDEPPSEEVTAAGETPNNITDVLLIMLSLV